jgi:hypothetical protein
MVSTKFLGLQIDDHLNWKNRIDQMVPKLSGACYAVRASVPVFFWGGGGHLILCI